MATKAIASPCLSSQASHGCGPLAVPISLLGVCWFPNSVRPQQRVAVCVGYAFRAVVSPVQPSNDHDCVCHCSACLVVCLCLPDFDRTPAGQ